jgi:hypothetical protein
MRSFRKCDFAGRLVNTSAFMRTYPGKRETGNNLQRSGVYRVDMHLSFGKRRLWLICIVVITSLAHHAKAQNAQQPILVSHDVIDGPTGDAHSIEDLRIFQDGRVTYTLQSKTPRSYTATISSDKLRGLVRLLDLPEIRALPRDLPVKTHPIDFFWDKSLRIVRSEGSQNVHIEHFYPFLNLDGPVYPQKLIEVECKLQDIKSTAATRPEAEENWCGDLLAHNLPESKSYECSKDEADTRIVEGFGWGAVHVGASLQTVQAVLGTGTPSDEFSDVHFVEYRTRGIEISFDRSDDKVHAIFFYNHQQGNGQFGVFCGKTDKGINWNSTVDEVGNAYGHPSANFLQGNSGRLQFSGIDFRFENGRLVRIGVPGR